MDTALLLIALSPLLFLVLYVLHFLYRLLRGEGLADGSAVGLPGTKAEVSIGSKDVVYGILFAIFLGWLFLYEPAPAYNVTADTLYQEFEENELAAHSKYKGELIRVTGVYSSSGVSLGRPWILLSTSSSVFTVQCFFSTSDAKKAASLRKGQTVMLTGEVDGQLGNVMLSDCKVN